MNDNSEQAIQGFGARSPKTVMHITNSFAMIGALLMIFTGGLGSWGIWIPFCFLIIPIVHCLCREVLRLRERMAELERRLSQR